MTIGGPFHFIALFSTGLLLGLKHALDADHVVAVSAIVSETKSLKRSSFLGALWGAGHTTALLVAGIAVLTFRLTIPTHLALMFEFLVGAMLVLLGIGVLRRILREKIHMHAHAHGSETHVHVHSHINSSSHYHGHRSFLVGVVHGLAGTAALALLVLSTVPSLIQGILFILIFGVGSIIGMLSLSAVIGLPFALAGTFSRLETFIKTSAGVAGIGFGVLIIYQISSRLFV